MISWSGITTIASTIYLQANKAKINKKQAERLIEHIRLLLSSVIQIGDVDQPSYDLQREELKNILNEALKLVSDFQAENWLILFVAAGGWGEQIALIHDRLDNHAQAFGIALEVDHTKNQTAMLEDLNDIKSVVVEILRKQDHTKEELEISAEILLFLKLNFIKYQGEQTTLINKFDGLMSELNSIAPQFPSITVTVVQKGAIVDRVEHTTAAAEYNLITGGGAPDEATQTAFKGFMSFGSTLPAKQTNMKVTVVEDGARVPLVIEKTVEFLLSLNVSPQASSSNSTGSLNTSMSHFSGTAIGSEQKKQSIKPGFSQST